MDAAAEAGAGERAAPAVIQCHVSEVRAFAGDACLAACSSRIPDMRALALPAASRSMRHDFGDATDRDGRALFVLLKRLEDQFPQLVLRRDVDDRTQQREAAPLAVDAVLPRRET